MLKRGRPRKNLLSKGNKTKAPQGSLSRAFAIMAAIRDAAGPMHLAGISAGTNLDSSTTLRILRTLEANGQILRISSSKAYILSPNALSPLPLMHPISQLRRETYPWLRELSTTLGETVVLVLYVGFERMAIDVAQSQNSLNPYYDTWLRGLRHATGVGKAQLLSMSYEKRREIIGAGPLRALTPYTITDPLELEHDLDHAKRRGYVVSRNEHRDGMTVIAANISIGKNEDIGSVAVSGHSKNFTDKRTAEIGQEITKFTKLLAYQATSLHAVSNYLGKQVTFGEVSSVDEDDQALDDKCRPFSA